MKKIFLFMIVVFLGIFVSSCRGKDNVDPIVEDSDFSYYEEKLTTNIDYNASLFYLNNLEFEIADPTVIYIDHGDQEGYFYAYGTSDDIRCNGFQSWRSQDLTHWEAMGIAFMPDYQNTWALTNYWAPEILYSEEDELYYLFYSAETLTRKGFYQLSVAYSEFPQGPFVNPDGIRNADGNMLSLKNPVYNVGATQEAIPQAIRRNNAIDISPFVDPKTGKKYIYFSYYDTFSRSEIFGMEMKDWFTPIYSTLVQLTSVGYLTVEAGENGDISKRTQEGTINEGPFVIYENDTYYLTLSVYGYTDEKYQVRQATASSPLGTYTKIKVEDGGTVIATDINWEHITSAGHHSFVKCGEQLFIAYHTFLNRNDISDGRALAVEEVKFVTNEQGDSVLHANGPTYSLQPLPEQISGYKNIAGLANIVATNTVSDSNVSYLNDGIIRFHNEEFLKEYEAKEGTSKITLTFPHNVTARSIMIYNSIDFSSTFVSIDDIAITYKYSENEYRVVHMKNLEFDWEWNADLFYETMKPGGSVIAEFNDLTINKIEITLRSVEDSTINIPEIIVLGKDIDSGNTTKFETYSYTNEAFPSPQIKIEGENIGDNHGLHTTYGYQVDEDNDSNDRYIVQRGPYDQYSYFKNIWSNSFYVEASITALSNKSLANDQYPKYGITVITPENTIFFYIDGIGNSRFGCAQRKLDNSDWDWNATEQLVTVPNASSTNGAYVKMAILRVGAEFFFLVNDEIVITYNSFNIFIEDYQSTCGFLTFNTEIRIKDYMATQDSEIVNGKYSALQAETNGNTFGKALSNTSTSGWDLSTDDGTSDAYVVNTLGGDQYLYFKDVNSNYFYAETKITVVASLGDPYPKLGICLKNGSHELFFYIDSNTSFTSKSLGYVQKNSPGSWDWGKSVTKTFSSLGSYKDNNYVTLSILRDHNKIYLMADGEVIFTLEDVLGFGNAEKCVVSILSFTTSIKITDYFIFVDDDKILDYLK